MLATLHWDAPCLHISGTATGRRGSNSAKTLMERTKKTQQVGLPAKCSCLLRTTKQTALFLLGHLQQQKCCQIHKQLLTCQNKCHKTKLRPIIQLQRFLRAIYNGNLYAFTRGCVWLALLCHSWSGILQPSSCLGLYGVESTSTGRRSCTPVNKYQLPFQTPTSKRCLHLLRQKSWAISLQLCSSEANFAISKSMCNYNHPSINAGGWRKKRDVSLFLRH